MTDACILGDLHMYYNILQQWETFYFFPFTGKEIQAQRDYHLPQDTELVLTVSLVAQW